MAEITSETSRAASSSRPRRGSSRATSVSPLGAHLRQERLRVGLSLRELARRLDVSPSLVSQIETDKIQPSVGTLYAIVSELGLSFDEVFAAANYAAARSDTAKNEVSPQFTTDDSGASGRVQRSDERSAIDLESGVRWERLTTWNDRDLDFLYTTYEVGGASSPEDKFVRHNGREFGIVITGRLGVTVGFEEHTLEAGDSISFESTIPHRLHNDGNEPVTAIWVVLGRHHEPR